MSYLVEELGDLFLCRDYLVGELANLNQIRYEKQAIEFLNSHQLLVKQPNFVLRYRLHRDFCISDISVDNGNNFKTIRSTRMHSKDMDSRIALFWHFADSEAIGMLKG